jgi:hypothetical protein
MKYLRKKVMVCLLPEKICLVLAQRWFNVLLNLKWIILILCFILFAMGCAVPYKAKVKDGVVYCKTRGVFKSKWYNYFERALSCIEGEFYQDALEDLDIAIKQRSDDQRMARMFAMHFIDYFPHREKGLVHFLLEDYHTAEKELKISIENEPSAKVYYYLDEIRKIAIHEKKYSHCQPPEIHVGKLPNEHTNEILTNSFPFMLTGVVQDQCYISTLTIASQPYLINKSNQHIHFDKAFEFSDGKHHIEIVAQSLSGLTSQLKLNILVDTAGPTISIISFHPISGIHGYLHDNSFLKSLTINDQQIDFPRKKTTEFMVPYPEIKIPVQITACDILGNKTTLVLHQHDIQKLMAPLMANNTANISDHAIVCAGNRAGTKPLILIDQLMENNTAYVQTLHIRGKAESKSPIKTLTVNQHPISLTSGNMIVFDYPFKLGEGNNRICVRAKDQAGNMSEKIIHIDKHIPNPLQLNERYRILVHDFSSMYHFEAPGFFDRIYSKIFKQKNKITGNNVRKHFIAHAHDRKRFQIVDADWFSASDASLFGKLRISRSGIEIAVRLIDNRTSEVLANKGIVKDVYCPVRESHRVVSIIKDLYETIHKEFPLIRGTITGTHNKTFLISSESKTTTMNWPLVIYVEHQPHHFLGSQGEIVGQGRLSGIIPSGYEAICEISENVQPGYRVISR